MCEGAGESGSRACDHARDGAGRHPGALALCVLVVGVFTPLIDALGVTCEELRSRSQTQATQDAEAYFTQKIAEGTTEAERAVLRCLRSSAAQMVRDVRAACGRGEPAEAAAHAAGQRAADRCTKP